MVDFKALKASSGKKSLQTLTAELNKLSGGEGKSSDDRFWAPTVDKAGNGYAVIRFLPPPANEDVPFIRMFDHGFQGPGGWYIENSLTTLGKNDPVSEYNSKLWNSGIEANKDIVRKQKRRLHFISNIYVVSDSGNPANEGKVFLFKYGKKIFDKLKEAMEPQFADEEAINPFDLWKGANFKLKIRKVEGYQNYDKSEFESPSALLNDDEELEKVWKSQYSLTEMIGDKEFKSYDVLKQRLDKVLGLNGEVPAAKTTVEQIKEAPKKVQREVEPDLEEDDDMAYFSKLAEEN
jgi:hypothetical protein